MSDALTDVAEDRSPGQRTFAGFACVKHGSDAHKHMLRRMLPETHDPYKPAVIHWPALSPDALGRPCLLPIRDVAVQAAGRASFPPANSRVTGKGPKAPAHRAMSCVKRPGHERPRRAAAASAVRAGACATYAYCAALHQTSVRAGHNDKETRP